MWDQQNKPTNDYLPKTGEKRETRHNDKNSSTEAPYGQEQKNLRFVYQKYEEQYFAKPKQKKAK